LAFFSLLDQVLGRGEVGTLEKARLLMFLSSRVGRVGIGYLASCFILKCLSMGHGSLPLAWCMPFRISSTLSSRWPDGTCCLWTRADHPSWL